MEAWGTGVSQAVLNVRNCLPRQCRYFFAGNNGAKNCAVTKNTVRQKAWLNNKLPCFCVMVFPSENKLKKKDVTGETNVLI